MRSLRISLLALLPASLALAQAITSSSPLPSGFLNSPYGPVQLTCTNCNGAVWGVSSGFPPGLSLSSATATITGTPTSAGTFGFVVSMTTPGYGSVTKNFQITIGGGTPTITSTSFPNGTLNTPYSQMLTATGGVPPYSWSVSGLPQGLALQQSGGNWNIVGTPTSVGSFGFTLTVYDSFQTPASVQTSITINSSGAGPAITTTAVPNGTLNQPYSYQLTCVNCSGYVWSLANATTLPAGLSLSPSGLISGTPTNSGSFDFTVSISSASQSFNSSITAPLSITINATSLGINESSIPVAAQNTPYSTTLTGTGGTPPYTWALQSTANDGLSINKSTGVISGTPVTTGLFTLVAQITDSAGLTATKNFTLNVVVQLSILTTSLPNGSVGNVYPTQTLSAGGGQPPYRWTISTGTLPPGLTLDGVFGRISGTPTTSGFYGFTLVVTDNQQNTASAKLSISVGNGITITPATLPAGAVGAAYSQPLTATGGQSPYTWSIAAGSLPAGVTLDPTSGLLAGTPTASGTFAFTVQANDSAKAFGQIRYALVIAAGPLSITTTSLPDGTIGAVYSQTLAAIGGTPPYTWAISTGTLPAGLTLNASTGAISGTPTGNPATSSFTVQATDAAKGTATQALSITTAAALSVTPTALPAAVVGVAYTQKLTASGGKGPYTFALTGTLPAGFVFTASTATISGTAPAVESGNFTITVTDSSGRTLNLPLTLTAAATPINLTPTTLTAVVGVPFTQKLTVTGGVAPYTFAQGLGSPPAGFKFDTATGTISGTATVAGSGVVNVVVTDSSGASRTFAIALTVNNPPAPTVTVTGVPATSGFSQQLPVTVAIGAPYPVNITGSVLLTFAPSVTPAAGVDDAMIQFSSGSRVIGFTIPAGSTTPTLNSASSITILTGTTAGTITVTTSLTTAGGVALGNTTKTIVNPSGVPFISSVAFQQTPGGVTVTVVGFSSTREMVSGLFHFAPATGKSFANPDITVPLAAPFLAWYSNTAQSNPFGTQFTLTVPFTLNTQSTSVVSVTVTLTNSKGSSNAVTLSQ